MRQYRIGYLAGQLHLGGAERQLYYLLGNLDREQFEPVVLTLRPCRSEWWESLISDLGVPVHDITVQSRFLRALLVRQRLANLRVDLIHSVHFFVTPYAWFASLGRKVPVVGWIRFLPDDSGMQKYGLGVVERIALSGPGCLVCNTKAAEVILKERLTRPDRVQVIANACEVPSTKVIAWRAGQATRKLRKGPADLVVGVISRLDIYKNVSLLLQAVAQLRLEFPEMRVVVVGDGPLRSNLETEARQLGLQAVVTFLGEQPFAEEFIPAFDVLCLTSNSEGMPNVLMEAAVVNVPVVATNVGGVPEVVRDGETGFLFPPGDAEAVVGSLRRLLQDRELRQRMGRAARARMQSCFSIKEMVKQYEDIYLELIQAGQRREAAGRYYQDAT